MRAKSNRLLMLLVGAAISGCANQTDRSSSSGSDRYQPEKESVQIVDRPLEKAPPPKPAPVATPAPKNEAVAEFPVTKYELPEEQDEPVEDLGPQDDESMSAAQDSSPAADSSVGETTEYAEEADEDEIGELGSQDDESISAAQEASIAADSSVGETTEYAEEAEEDEIGELGSQEDESVSSAQEPQPSAESSVVATTEYPEAEETDEIDDLGPQADESTSADQAALPAGESTVGETTEYAEAEEADEMEELGPQEDESSSAEQPASLAGESTVGEATQYAEQEEEADVVEDLGTQPDDSGTAHYPEDKRAAADRVVGEPRVYAEETAPKQKPAPAAPRSVTVSFESEPLFGFDKFIISADGKMKLDELVTSLRNANIESISVIGHADRIGGKAYNQKLSERRAASVNKYLSSKGIQADRIHTEGRGQSEPVSGDACSKLRGNKLIICLQPDRRVDVNVTATKQKN